jgi:hypothetical protein
VNLPQNPPTLCVRVRAGAEKDCTYYDGERKLLFHFDGLAGAGDLAISTEITKLSFRPVYRLW